ncbi:uncharacterized protein LOC141673185 [Apium graveolens]|uniref:uncharacterized protein LOC141673185 n=1 Tax=Apium graveolens TaxID=4045 RepID=UPI003D79703E
MDVQKVIEGGSWSFEQAMLVLHQVKPGEDPLMIKLREIDMWVQVYDIPQGFLSENILKSVGSAMGRYIKLDPDTFEGGWKQFVRITVAVNIEKPLKRRLKIKREGGSWSWLNFKYERLGTFCFVCGIIGHSERDCNIVYANPEKLIEKAYGTWLRAPSRNARNNAGARWIRNARNGNGMWGKQGSQSNRNEGSTAAHGADQEKERFMEIEDVIREKNAEEEEIRVKSRDCSNQLTEDVVSQRKSKKRAKKRASGGSCSLGPPRIMSLIVWNCRGLANPRTVRFLNELNKTYRPSAVFLSETLVKKNKVEKVSKILGFAVDPQGHGGGVALIWKNEGGINIVDSCSNFIDFEVQHEQLGRWRYTGYYGYPERGRRAESWDMMRRLAGASTLPWCLIGDFNDIVTMEEKTGGSRQPRVLLDGFAEAITDCGLADLCYTGDRYTWEMSRGTSQRVQERLDRGLATSEWIEMFPGAEVRVLEVSTSDHKPLFLQLNRQVYVPKRGRFRFENMWIEDNDCRNIVKGCWSNEGGSNMMDKMVRCCAKLEE